MAGCISRGRDEPWKRRHHVAGASSALSAQGDYLVSQHASYACPAISSCVGVRFLEIPSSSSFFFLIAFWPLDCWSAHLPLHLDLQCSCWSDRHVLCVVRMYLTNSNLTVFQRHLAASLGHIIGAVWQENTRAAKEPFCMLEHLDA